MHSRGGEHAGGRGAVLPRVEVRRAGDPLGGGRDVGVVEDDDRGLAAELQVDTLQVRRCGARHLHAGAHAPGDRHHGGLGMGDELATGVPVAADDVEHPGRQVLAHHLRHQQAADRGRVRGLEHHGVPCGQRRRPLPHGHHERVVPGRHGRAHPDRLPAYVGGVTFEVLRGGPTLQEPRRPREEPDLVDRGRDLLGHGEREGLAGVSALGLHELLGARLDGVGYPQEGERALGGGPSPPPGEGRLGRTDRPLDVLAARERSLGEHLAGARIDDRGHCAVDRLDVLPADEVVELPEPLRSVAHVRLRCGLAPAPSRRPGWVLRRRFGAN